jgi:acetoin utilization deacetylase AcuC-like enzyme
MSTNAPFLVVEDPRYRAHRAPEGHPENPERLIAVSTALEMRRNELTTLEPRHATPEEILRIHGETHLRRMKEAVAQAPVRLDADTYLSPASHEVALLAAGASVDLALRVARREASSGLAAVRPPGHHAESSRAMGFCLFNNVAIAARALQTEEGIDKVLILDWDVHHGNGTQHSFEDDPSILYVSTHQFPYYPGTGDAGEVGTGRGSGSNVNVPLPAGCGDAEYIGVFQRVLVPVIRRFAPQMILVSCGFDAHRDDPLASMNVTRDGFLAMTTIVRALVDELCGGRVCFILEGGYDANGLIEGTSAVLDGMLGTRHELPPNIDLEAGSSLRVVVDRVAAAQRSHFPDIGAS